MNSAAITVSTGTNSEKTPLLLMVRMLTKQVIHVEAFGSDTVLDLKMLLQDTVGHPAAQLKLIFTHQGSDPVLEDNNILQECGIMDGSELYLIIITRSGYYPHLMQKEPESVSLSVRIRRGNCVVVKTHRSDTVRSVKLNIENQTGMPAVQQTLTYCDEDMNDEKTLEHYDIRDRCVVHLSLNNPEETSSHLSVGDRGSRADSLAEVPKLLLSKLRHAFLKDM